MGRANRMKLQEYKILAMAAELKAVKKLNRELIDVNVKLVEEVCRLQRIYES